MEAPSIIREYAPIRSLRLFTSIPDNHRVVMVRQPDPGSIYSAGMYVVIDPAQTELIDGADFAMLWKFGPRFNFREMAHIREIRRGLGGWCTAPAGGAHSQIMGKGEPVTLLDGPMEPDGLRRRIVGRVVGYLGDRYGDPLGDLWPEDFDQPWQEKAFDLGDLPSKYVCATSGHCLAPHFNDGDKLEFSALDPVAAGDYVCLWLKPQFYHAGIEFQCMVKRLLTPLPVGPFPLPDMPAPPVIIVEMDNPRRRMMVPLDRVIAVHKCLGVYRGPQWKPTRVEMRALVAAERKAVGDNI